MSGWARTRRSLGEGGYDAVRRYARDWLRNRVPVSAGRRIDPPIIVACFGTNPISAIPR